MVVPYNKYEKLSFFGNCPSRNLPTVAPHISTTPSLCTPILRTNCSCAAPCLRCSRMLRTTVYGANRDWQKDWLTVTGPQTSGGICWIANLNFSFLTCKSLFVCKLMSLTPFVIPASWALAKMGGGVQYQKHNASYFMVGLVSKSIQHDLSL